MVDVLYARGWDGCLETVSAILKKSKTIEEVMEKVKYLHDLVKTKKFEQIMDELGVIREIF